MCKLKRRRKTDRQTTKISLVFHINPQHQAPASLQIAPGKPLTPQHVKGKFQCLLNRVCCNETFVAMKCRSAASGDLLYCYSIFIISYKIQSDIKITGPVTLTRLNLMGCPLQMNSTVNNLCVLSLLCGFS